MLVFHPGTIFSWVSGVLVGFYSAFASSAPRWRVRAIRAPAYCHSRTQLLRCRRMGVAVVRAVVVDDHEIVAKAVASMLEASGVSVAALLGRWNRVADVVADIRPDLLVVDVKLPPHGGDGIVAVAQVKRHNPNVRVVCLSCEADPQVVERATAAGADGFISKWADVAEMERVCHDVISGETGVMDRRTAALLAAHYKNRFESASSRSLSLRELAVLRMLCEGESNPQIASKMNLARSSVAGLVSQVFSKLGVSDRAAAAATAVRSGLVD